MLGTRRWTLALPEQWVLNTADKQRLSPSELNEWGTTKLPERDEYVYGCEGENVTYTRKAALRLQWTTTKLSTVAIQLHFSWTSHFPFLETYSALEASPQLVVSGCASYGAVEWTTRDTPSRCVFAKHGAGTTSEFTSSQFMCQHGPSQSGRRAGKQVTHSTAPEMLFFFLNHEHVLHGSITWRRHIKSLLSLQFYALRVTLKSGGKQEQSFEQVPNSGHPSLPHVLAENIAAIAQLPDSNKIFHNCFEAKHNKTNEYFSKVSMKCVLY